MEIGTPTRLVEILAKDYLSVYNSRAPAKILRICRDSCEAVINLYPYCFSSQLKECRIRSNLSLTPCT
jgi:hypothetical protein